MWFEILDLCARDRSTLVLSEKTVKNHVSPILAKLAVMLRLPVMTCAPSRTTASAMARPLLLACSSGVISAKSHAAPRARRRLAGDSGVQGAGHQGIFPSVSGFCTGPATADAGGSSRPGLFT
jgi:predicted outer membrane lipoprotein